MKHISLYIHIPFCVRKCLYCDFTSFPDKTDRIEDYLHRLECEMDEAVSRFGDLTVDTLFLGGGTPSLLHRARRGDHLRGQSRHAGSRKNARLQGGGHQPAVHRRSGV